MALCELPCLKAYCVAVGSLLLLLSVGGIGFSLFMLFGEPFAQRSGGTYRPSWEDIGPCFLSSLISLLVNVALVGGAAQRSRKILSIWLAWHSLLLLLFWTWYGYSQLKYHGWIDWRAQGMRECYWCTLRSAKHVGFGSAVSSAALLGLMVPVQVFRGKLKRRHRELTEYEMAPGPQYYTDQGPQYYEDQGPHNYPQQGPQYYTEQGPQNSGSQFYPSTQGPQAGQYYPSAEHGTQYYPSVGGGSQHYPSTAALYPSDMGQPYLAGQYTQKY